MSSVIPKGASVTPLPRKLAEMDAPDLPQEWRRNAVEALRGGDGGEHGLLLYKLVSKLCRDGPLVVLDVGTARGFSALTMARAMLDGGLEGRVYSVDVVGHDETLGWHADKHEPGEPLDGVETSRREIWRRWFPEESARVTPIRAASSEVLASWGHGPIDLAFLDGSHAYEDVTGELAALDSLMAEGGVVVVDDLHLGATVVRVRSRLINAFPWAMGRLLGRLSSSLAGWSRRLSTSNEHLVVTRRHYGVWRAVAEHLERRRGAWSLDIVPMPSRGDYQGEDYSLAVLCRGGSRTAPTGRRRVTG